MKRLSSSLLLVLALAGCQHPMGAPIGNFGDTVRHNVELQVIDPEPTVAAAPSYDGTRAALMIARYQVDEIDEPVDLRTVTFGAVASE